MRKLYVVRHADAGHRADSDQLDHLRVLSKRGRRQADAITAMLVDVGVTHLVSSPYLRCVQTLEPLGEQLGIEVELDDRLAEGKGGEGAYAIAHELRRTTAVLCSHGDVIPDLLDVVQAAGTELEGELRCRKASTWILESERGRITTGRYVPPPA